MGHAPDMGCSSLSDLPAWHGRFEIRDVRVAQVYDQRGGKEKLLQKWDSGGLVGTEQQQDVSVQPCAAVVVLAMEILNTPRIWGYAWHVECTGGQQGRGSQGMMQLGTP